MAARRFVKTSIDWAAFAEKIPPKEKPNFQKFKARADSYMKNVMSLPEKPPTIDFASYRSRFPNQALVNEFEKQYNAVKVPYPADKLTPLVDEQEKVVDAGIKAAKEVVDLRCEILQKHIDWFNNMLPYEDMTMEDLYSYFPDSPKNIIKYPNFWPHDEPFRPVFPYLSKEQLDELAAKYPRPS